MIYRKNTILFILLSSYSLLFTMQPHSSIYIAGHRGLVGSALVSLLQNNGYTNLITRTSQELDLRNQEAVNAFFEQERPEYVFLLAAKVGGIKANMTYPADFIYDNLAIELNIIHAAHHYGVKKLLFMGSSCIYPRLCSQPMKEEYLLTGPLEPTNEGYAIAKIAGIKLCQTFNRQYGTHFITCMPTNLFGPGDNFNPETAHALPALIARMHTAKEKNAPTVSIWGSGSARREWLYVDDLANACLFLMLNYEGNDIINIGTGQDISMKELAYTIKDIVDYRGELVFDTTKPEGMPQKLLDVNRIHALGWQSQTNVEIGIQKTYKWYVDFISSSQ